MKDASAIQLLENTLLPIASEPATNVFAEIETVATECRMNITATKKPGGDPPGFSKRCQRRRLCFGSLEHAQHDRADKGKGKVRGHDAQLSEEGTKGHGNAPKVTSLTALTTKPSNRFHDKKVSVAVHPAHLGGAIVGDVVKES